MPGPDEDLPKPVGVRVGVREVVDAPHRDGGVEGGGHPRDRWCRLRRCGAVAGDEVFALERHAMLDGDTAAKRRDTLDVTRADRLRMVDGEARGERDAAVDPFEHA